MASVSFCEDLTCSVCVSIFTDPVNLPCGHSFCRQCITSVLNVLHRCPHCRMEVSADPEVLPSSLILKSLAEKAKEAEKFKKTGGHETAEMAEFCPEHEEKLKLFCVTDQQLVCIICRDGEKHEGHKFKPIKEAAASLRKELEMFLQHAAGDVSAVQSLASAQEEEVAKTREKSQQLMRQVSSQFQEMHQFLKQREDEIKTELKHKKEDHLEKMTGALNNITTALSESRELEAKAASVLKISDSLRFLKTWTEGSHKMSPEQLFRPRANKLIVINSALCLDPYESHLQFFMWKEMLMMIQPRAERLAFTPKTHQTQKSSTGHASSSFCTSSLSAFGTGFGTPPPSGGLFGAGHTGHASSSFGNASTSTFGTSGLAFSTPPPSGGGLFGATSSFSFGGSSSASIDTLVKPQIPDTSVTHYALSVTEFTSGLHYWEIDVRNTDFWELGIEDHYLQHDGQKYATCGKNVTTELALDEKPGKIGIYLNCSSKELSFYDADIMRHIHTVSVSVDMPVCAYANIKLKKPDDSKVKVCWY